MRLSENLKTLMGIITKKSSDKVFIHTVASTGISFILSKGVAFISPIILMGFISLQNYGRIEYSYGLGRLLAGIAGCGLGGYPYFVLKRGEENKRAYFYGYGFAGLLASSLFLILKSIKVLPIEVLFSYLFTFVFTIQGLYSTILKTENKGHKGVLVDSGYYFILTLVIIGKVVFKNLQILPVLMWLMWGYLCCFSLFFSFRFFHYRRISNTKLSFLELKEIISYGLPLIVSGFIIYWMTSSARIYIGHLIGYEQVGIYSFYFRIVGISVVLQQFLYVAFFKKLYLGSSLFLDKYYTVLMFVVFVCCLLVSAVALPIVRTVSSEITIPDYKLMLLLCVQMPLWVGISFCEGLTGRENIVNKVNLRLGLIVLGFAILLFTLGNRLNLHIFSLCMILQFCIAFFAQLHLLSKKGVVLQKCKIFCVIPLVLGVIIYFI